MALFSLQSEFGTLKLTGYLRGRNLSVNRLVHLPGWGDYQMTQIDAVNDPYPLLPKSDKRNQNTGIYNRGFNIDLHAGPSLYSLYQLYVHLHVSCIKSQRFTTNDNDNEFILKLCMYKVQRKVNMKRSMY